jgi:hypothetical protein
MFLLICQHAEMAGLRLLILLTELESLLPINEEANET